MGIDNSQSRAGSKLTGVYLVGGAVRDKLLNLPVVDRDWVVVGATKEMMLERGFKPVLGDFPVFLHPETGEEYALARREIKTAPGYHGFQVEYGTDVTLEQDLARRDLTINAMAEDEFGTIIDPYHGQQDLQHGLLRHVTPAFVEDPVRVLRVARFAARLGGWGFHVAHGTHGLMKKMAASGELNSLPGQRIWKEMSRALMDAQPWRFFEVLHRCGALEQLFPVLAQALSASAGHGSSAEQHQLEVLRLASNQGLELPLRFVCVMQFAVEENHSGEALCRFLGVGKKITNLLLLWLRLRPLIVNMSQKRPEDFHQFFSLVDGHLAEVEALAAICLPEIAQQGLPVMRKAKEAMQSVDGAQLRQQGWQGKALGDELKRRQIQAIAEVLGSEHEN